LGRGILALSSGESPVIIIRRFESAGLARKRSYLEEHFMSRYQALHDKLHRPHRRVAALAFIAVGASCFASSADAQLKIYYDPVTGNVALDTTNTRSGELNGYGFSLNGRSPLYPNLPKDPPWVFRHENLIRLTESTLYLSTPRHFGETTLTNPMRGLFTVGDMLPIGLSEEFWTTSFVKQVAGNDLTTWAPYGYSYNDVISGGPAPEAEFIYGRPSGEFQNKWDLVDPATLTWAKTATLIYHDWSGEVFLDTTGTEGGYISRLLVTSDDAFLPDGYTPITEGPFNVATSSSILLNEDALEPGSYSLGQILQPGLSASQFAGLFNEARFMGRAGFNGGDFDFATHGANMSLQFVPEPSMLLQLALALAVTIVGIRRR
jgi:hypothetical protein